MKKKFVYLALIILSGSILIYGCKKGYNSMSSTTYGGGGGTGATASVVVQNMAFTPDTLNIKTGTTVTWSNMDDVTHTVTEVNGLFSSGNIGAGQTYQYTFGSAGSFTYYCTIHATMKNAVVIVSN